MFIGQEFVEGRHDEKQPRIADARLSDHQLLAFGFRADTRSQYFRRWFGFFAGHVP